jgi:hypothetical protein
MVGVDRNLVRECAGLSACEVNEDVSSEAWFQGVRKPTGLGTSSRPTETTRTKECHRSPRSIYDHGVQVAFFHFVQRRGNALTRGHEL